MSVIDVSPSARSSSSTIAFVPVADVVKSLARLEAAGAPDTIAELVTPPLGERRHHLNGSGLLLVRPPAGALETLAAAEPVIGEYCATARGAR
ncbi:MAG: hypothetical protein U0807_04150 [Candidatus Binatia bacterium]